MSGRKISNQNRDMIFFTQSARGTERAARAIFNNWRNRRDPLVFALSGDLGAGKTAFARGLGRALGISARIQSPTFVLVRSYPLARRRAHRFALFAHADAYRLASAREATRLGFKKLFAAKGTVAAVEWAERVRPAIPKSALWVYFSYGPKRNERRIRIAV